MKTYEYKSSDVVGDCLACNLPVLHGEAHFALDGEIGPLCEECYERLAGKLRDKLNTTCDDDWPDVIDDILSS